MPEIKFSLPVLKRALEARQEMLDEQHSGALRLFNGFLEGCPDLVVDLYARTLVIFNYANDPVQGEAAAAAAQEWLLKQLPWVQAVLRKTRLAEDAAQRQGILTFGETPDREIQEHGVRYALDLTLQQDASFYLDTRNLRRWLIDTMRGKSVLNTFAYTGSLGVAALAGDAAAVIQTDRSTKFLDLARRSASLNGFPASKCRYPAGDFFRETGRLKKAGRLFDCVLIDPPFFSASSAGRVDLVNEAQNLINKVRPLIAHEGHLVAINNALFVSGADYMRSLEALCSSGYLEIETLIPVPEDITGFETTRSGDFPSDPAPFNHTTKIAVLKVFRKDGRTGRVS